ncbi:hypothetical protein POM88_013574 [Heracleum sosnowskyi]|uniref:Uncharacterized protein n=1 Tax=Heracleum sosnowskyi TaxID=360622 RepID=A0AAD8N4H2_9APIA|nr:hypothetical protein POM88_013574 [Heracleum sosnowskyi]
MASRKSLEEEMEESFARINLEEEEGGLIFEDSCESLSEIDVRWCLVGRQGGSFPVENSAVDGGDKGGDAGVVVAKEREYNPMILGDSVGEAAGGGLAAGRVIVGNRKDRVFENATN